MDRLSTSELYPIEGRSPRASDSAVAPSASTSGTETPAYLMETYWWAYAHPNSVKVFERDWLIDAILWGNYERLRQVTEEALGPDFSGRSLQVACAYGDFTPELADKVDAAEGHLDVIDALPVQIENVRRKIGARGRTRATLMDSAALTFADGTFDRAVMFLLLHEMPDEWRKRTVAEIARVLKPGGRLVVVDYAKPAWYHPLRYLFPPVLKLLEPFALDLWRRPIDSFFAGTPLRFVTPRRAYFGGLYQLVVLEKPAVT